MSAQAKPIVDDATRETYRQDGVVRLRRAFDASWLETAANGIARNRAAPSPLFRDNTPEGSNGAYVFDYWTWRETPEFEDLIFRSPAPAIAAALLGTGRTRFLMDNWFLNEVGATGRAPWHHDEPYFDFDGTALNLLIFLDPLPAAEGLKFVRGSHRWGKLFKAVHFRDDVPFDGQADDPAYADMPDLSGAEVLTWDAEPGDCIAFDLRTIHRGAARGEPASVACRRMSLRYGAPDVRFRPRGSWTDEISAHLMALGQKPDAPLDNPLCPEVVPPG